SSKDMNINSIHTNATEDKGDPRPILVVPYMWIGDFVRGHTVVRILKQRWPNRPIDLLTTSLCAPLADYMPGVRSGILWDLRRSSMFPPRKQSAGGKRAGWAPVPPWRWRRGRSAHPSAGPIIRRPHGCWPNADWMSG